MHINSNGKWIFIHIPKTGGMTIRKSFGGRMIKRIEQNDPNVPPEQKAHSNVRQIRDEYKDYFTFTVVRNPWDRLVSYYSFLCQRKMLPGEEHYPVEKWRANGFKDWLLNDKFYPTWANPPQPYEQIRNQSDFIEVDGKLAVDYILRFEHLEAGLNDLGQRINLYQRTPIYKRNPSIHKPYREMYDDDAREFVELHHQRDISRFNYSF